MKEMIGYCGLDCEKCDAYLATINDDQQLREKTAQLWSELNHAEIHADDIDCEGCRPQGRKTYYCGNICAIRQCAIKKAVVSCADCPEAKGCQILMSFHANNPEAAENLKSEGEFELFSLRQIPEMRREATRWFHEKWGVSEDSYLECMDAYLNGQTEYGWYLCLHEGKIVGGLGVIENDFHDRKDLTPNVCAVYTEEKYRCKGIAGALLNRTVEDMRSKGISPLYLVTDHDGFYERYGWEFFCMVQSEGESGLSRLYIHR